MPVADSSVDPSYLALFLPAPTPCPHRESPKNDGSVFSTAIPGVLPEPALKHFAPPDLTIGGAPLFQESFLALDCLLQLCGTDQLRWQEFVRVLNGLTTHPGKELFVLIYNMIPIVIALNSQLCSVAVSVN